MSKMRVFVRPAPERPEQTRRDKVLTAVSISLGCLIIAAVLRALFEIWQHIPPHP